MKEKGEIDWKIIYTANGIRCENCGKTGYPYIKGICWASTNGLKEHYHHSELEMVLDVEPAEISRVLNTLGLMVKNGRHFASGDLVDSIYADCPIRLDRIEHDGDTLRVIIPDSSNRWPEDPACERPYCLQSQPIGSLGKIRDLS